MNENINQRTFVSNFNSEVENPSENGFFCSVMKQILNELTYTYAMNQVDFIVHFKETVAANKMVTAHTQLKALI